MACRLFGAKPLYEPMLCHWTPRSKLQSYCIRNLNNCIHENVFENVVWKMSDILSRLQCVKPVKYITKLILVLRGTVVFNKMDTAARTAICGASHWEIELVPNIARYLFPWGNLLAGNCFQIKSISRFRVHIMQTNYILLCECSQTHIDENSN